MRSAHHKRIVAATLAAAASVSSALDPGLSALARITSPVCGGDGWCWEYRAFPRELNGLWGTSRSDIWLVGQSNFLDSTILHWDGAAWSAVGWANDLLTSVWASAPDDAWAVGLNGTIVRWDGRQWTPVDSPTRGVLRNVWGRARDDVWAVGDKGVAIHYDGRAWRVVPTETSDFLQLAWSGARDEAWIAGPSVLLRWDGERLHASEGAPKGVVAVGGKGRGDAWLVTEAGDLWRWDGARWSRLGPGADRRGLGGAGAGHRGTFVSAPDAIWRAGHRDGVIDLFDGRAWRTHWVPGTPHAIWGAAPDDLWAAGYKGVLLHWDGKAWAPAALETRFPVAIFAIAPDEIWAVGTGFVLRRTSSGWKEMPAPAPDVPLASVFGSSADDVWVCGESIWHWDGKTWARSREGFPCKGLWGVGRNSVWAVGPKGALHWNGKEWEGSLSDDMDSGARGSAGPEYDAVWAASPDDAWAVGCQDCCCGHYTATIDYLGNGTDRLSGELPEEVRGGAGSTRLTWIWGSSAQDVYVAGPSQPLAHWDGSRWKRATPGPGGSIDNVVGIWGRGRNDVWVARHSIQGAILRWDGRRWTNVASNIKSPQAITGTPARVWVITDGGDIVARPREGR